MKKIFYFMRVLTLFFPALFLVGCGSSETTSTTDSSQNAASTTAAEENNNTNEAEETSNELQLDFPDVATTAQAGEYTLAPTREAIDKAATEGVEDNVFIFYNNTMVEPGETESTVKELIDEVSIPNSLLIPIPKGETAEPGDVVLTWWQSGSGMQRAYVTTGGTPTEPMVYYLDVDLDNPATTPDGTPIAEKAEQLQPDSFVKLTQNFQPGTAVAVQQSSDYKHYQVIAEAEDKLLLLGFAGRLSVASKALAVGIPVQPNLVVGDAVMVPYLGSFTPGTVTNIDKDRGRVFVEFEFGTEKKTVGFAFGNVLLADDITSGKFIPE